MKKYTAMGLIILVALMGINSAALAGNVTVPHSFTSGTKAMASEVNNNFNAVASAANDNDSRIDALELALQTLQSTVSSQETTINALSAELATAYNSIGSLQSTVSSQETTINTLSAELATVNDDIGSLQADVVTINSNSVLLLDNILTYITDDNDYPTALFSGVNVQVTNGDSQGTRNGVGNLIVGYNDPTNASAPLVCSSPVYETQEDCETAGNVWSRNHKSGSHNVVAGTRNSYSGIGGLVYGTLNIVTGNNASAGGYGNVASGRAATVSAGYVNIANGDRSSISGGWDHIASGTLSSITGGERNSATAGSSSVHGGFNNTASGGHSSILGGSSQTNSTNFGTTPALP